jgi:hypothetical protein
LIYLIGTGEVEKDARLERDAALMAQRPKRGAIARSAREVSSLLGQDKKIHIVAYIGRLSPDSLAEHLISALGQEKLDQIEQVTLHSNYSAFVENTDDLSDLMKSFAGQFYEALRIRAGRSIKVKGDIGAAYAFPGGANRIRKKQVTRKECDAALKALATNGDHGEAEARSGETHLARMMKEYFYGKGEGRVYFQDGKVFKVSSQGLDESYNTWNWIVDEKER